MTEKICTECQKLLPLSNFSIQKLGKFGRTSKCRSCRSKKYYTPVIIIDRPPALSVKDQRKQYYIHNRDIILAKSKQWYQDNKQHKLEYDQNYRTLNLDRLRMRTRVYTSNNLQKIQDQTRKYRNSEIGKLIRKNSNIKRKRRLKGQLSLSELLDFQKQSTHCSYCNIPLPAKWHIDHIIPISKGGEHILSNICASCPTCNLQKGTLMPDVFRQKQNRKSEGA